MTDQMKRIPLDVPQDLCNQIDKARGLVPRNVWLREVIEREVSPRHPATLIEQGRRLASQREDLIAAGVDPSELEVPLAPPPRKKVTREPVDEHREFLEGGVEAQQKAVASNAALCTKPKPRPGNPTLCFNCGGRMVDHR